MLAEDDPTARVRDNRTLMPRRLLSLAVCTLLVAAAGDAGASGLYYTQRGARPLGRGGAFVAGADDIGAIWYNPAGLADAGSSVLVDLAWLNFKSDFTRRTQVADRAGTLYNYDYPTVEGTTKVVPIPTIGGSYQFGDKKQYTAAFGIVAPYTAIQSYPLEVGGQPSPSRYALVSLDGSALVIAGGFFAYKPVEWFRVGAGVQLLTGTFQSTVVFSANPPDRLIGAPEDPQYDSLSQLKVGPIFTPSGNLGMTFVPHERVRIGLVGQLPFIIDAPAKVSVRLPTAAPFDKAYQDGDEARVRFRLPATIGAGVEYRHPFTPDVNLRVEASYGREFWSLHDTVDIRSENVKLYGITGFPSPFGVAPISIPRGFQDANLFGLGGELAYKIGSYRVDTRAGFNYSQSAVPTAYVSPFALDTDKFTVSIGGSLYLVSNKLRLDALYARVISSDAIVPPEEAKVPRINPVKGNPTKTEAINGGTYAVSANVFGVGMNYKF